METKEIFNLLDKFGFELIDDKEELQNFYNSDYQVWVSYYPFERTLFIDGKEFSLSVRNIISEFKNMGIVV